MIMHHYASFSEIHIVYNGTKMYGNNLPNKTPHPNV